MKQYLEESPRNYAYDSDRWDGTSLAEILTFYENFRISPKTLKKWFAEIGYKPSEHPVTFDFAAWERTREQIIKETKARQRKKK